MFNLVYWANIFVLLFHSPKVGAIRLSSSSGIRKKLFGSSLSLCNCFFASDLIVLFAGTNAQYASFSSVKCFLNRLKANKGNLTDEDFCLLEESLNFYDSSIKTGNINIDALIQDKLIYCNSLGIELYI